MAWASVLKERVRLLLPPAVIVGLRRLRPSAPPVPSTFNWSGVYESFAQVPVVGTAYAGRVLAQKSAESTVACMKELERGTSAGGYIPAPRDGGLLTLLATEVVGRQAQVSILDFGGAAGIDYVFLRALTRSSPISVDYTVIDHPAMCEFGRDIHAGDPAIHFSEVAGDGSRPDIIYASASLAYVEKWRSQLSGLMELDAEYFVLANTFVGAFPTFASAQLNLHDTVAAMWFFSRAAVIQAFCEGGYRLLLEVSTGLDYDQSNLPADRRAGRARNLVFRKREGR